MDAVTVFHERSQEYDHWFDENERVYQAKLAALQQFIPRLGIRVEIDVGTGRFAVPLGVAVGIEPAWHMAQIAHRRGIAVCQAVGDQLPFRESQFDFPLARPRHLLRRRGAAATHRRALRAQTAGRTVMGLIDRNSAFAQSYEARRATSTFYRQARFYSATQVGAWTQEAGFFGLEFRQTLLDFMHEAVGSA